MFHPVGSKPPTVYWRRRLIAFGSAVLLIVLLVLTLRAVSGRGDSAAALSAAGSSTAATTAVAAPAPSTSANSTAATYGRASTRAGAPRAGSAPASRPASSTASSTAAPARCASAQLAVAAVVGQASYKVGEAPALEMQVTNTGKAPCVQDFADPQIVMSVYNGESRVWGSHDCEVQPGTDDRTLAVNAPFRIKISWSGLTSQPKCAGTRQRVGAGTYTLYVSLSGKTGTAGQFAITG